MKYYKEFKEFIMESNKYWDERHFQVVDGYFCIRELQNKYEMFEMIMDKINSNKHQEIFLACLKMQ